METQWAGPVIGCYSFAGVLEAYFASIIILLTVYSYAVTSYLYHT